MDTVVASRWTPGRHPLRLLQHHRRRRNPGRQRRRRGSGSGRAGARRRDPGVGALTGIGLCCAAALRALAHNGHSSTTPIARRSAQHGDHRTSFARNQRKTLHDRTTQMEEPMFTSLRRVVGALTVGAVVAVMTSPAAAAHVDAKLDGAGPEDSGWSPSECHRDRQAGHHQNRGAHPRGPRCAPCGHNRWRAGTSRSPSARSTRPCTRTTAPGHRGGQHGDLDIHRWGHPLGPVRAVRPLCRTAARCRHPGAADPRRFRRQHRGVDQKRPRAGTNRSSRCRRRASQTGRQRAPSWPGRRWGCR